MPENPLANFRFRVEIDGLESAGFHEVEIREQRVDVIEYREGGDLATAARKLPGRVRCGNIILRRGVQRNNDLFDWWRQTRDGVIERRNGVIVLQNEDREDTKRWLFRNAWVVAYKPPDLNAEGNEVAIESIELVHEGLEIED